MSSTRHRWDRHRWERTPLPDPAVAVRGAAELVPGPDGVAVHRLPASVRPQLPDGFVRMCDEQPAGVRLVTRTSARRLELDLRAWRTRAVDRPVPAAAAHDVVVDGVLVAQAHVQAHGVLTIDHATARTWRGDAPVGTLAVDLPAGEKDVEVWLSGYEVVRLLELRTDAAVRAPEPSSAPRWVHHGSSISHGASASSPTRAWPVVAAQAAGLDLVNLGFSGNAVLDPFVARAVRDQPADLVTLKLGINVVNHDCFRLRTFRPAVEGFLDTVRDGHPATPLVVVSPLLCPMVEHTPGPTSVDPDSPADAPVFVTYGRPEELAEGKLSLTAIRRVLGEVVTRRQAAGDDRLHLVDGLDLFGPAEWDAMPMPDLLHPDDAGHRHVGRRFAQLAAGLAR